MATKSRNTVSPEVEAAIRELRAFHKQGRDSLRELGARSPYEGHAVEKQAERWGTTLALLRKARQFARPEEGKWKGLTVGYSREQLDELFRLMRKHKRALSTSHIGILITISWDGGRADLQKRCIREGWSTARLEKEINKQRDCPRVGCGRLPRVGDKPIDALYEYHRTADSWQRLCEAVGGPDKDDDGGEDTLFDQLPEQVREQVRSVDRAMQRLRKVVDKELGPGWVKE